VAPAKVVILGGGVAGRHAADVALGHRADVVLFDISPPVLTELDARFDGRLKTLVSTPDAIAEAVAGADLVIGAVLVPGASAPKLVQRGQLAGMRRGAVLVDVAIDQGGCFETSRPTTHDDPVFTVDGVVHYCVANMPGAAPLTSSLALCVATAPYVEALADDGLGALTENPGLAAGLNVEAGTLTHPAVAQSLAG
jgi:alanine dehydrogenase